MAVAETADATAQPTSSTANEAAPRAAEWDEPRLTSSLARLETIQTQLDTLRFAIPHMLAPLALLKSKKRSVSHVDSPFADMHIPDATDAKALTTPPTAVIREFGKRAVESQKRVGEFRKAWESKEVREVMERAKVRGSEDAEMGASTGVGKYGWVDRDRVLQEERSREGMEEEKGETVRSEDEVGRIVGGFKREHPKFFVDVEREKRIVRIQFRTPSTLMKFVINWSKKDSADALDFDVECNGPTVLFPAITRCMATRPRKNDLKYLLEMIAAYVDVRKVKCARCDKYLDAHQIIPAARRSKTIKTEDGGSSTVWQAVHETCL